MINPVLAETLEAALEGPERRRVGELAEDVLGARAAEALDDVEDLAVELVGWADHEPWEAILAILKRLEALVVLDQHARKVEDEVLEVAGEIAAVVGG